MDKPNKISAEDLRVIQEAKANATYLQALLEKAQMEKYAGDLQVKNVTLMAYLKYGLSHNDTIDQEGNIIKQYEAANQDNLTPAPQPTPQPVSNKKKKVA